MGKQQIIENETQRQIYNYILEYPGLHLRELSRKLDVPISTLNYHLRCLRKRGLIFTDFEQRFARIYSTKDMGSIQKKLINALRQETTRNIILYIGMNFYASRAELCKELDASPTTMGKYLKRLLKMGIIEPAPVENGMICTSHENKIIIEYSSNGREIVYRLTRPTSINKHIGKLLDELFNSYETGLVDETTRIVLDYVDILLPEKKLPKKFREKKYQQDQFFRHLMEIFPHPYHV